MQRIFFRLRGSRSVPLPPPPPTSTRPGNHAAAAGPTDGRQPLDVGPVLNNNSHDHEQDKDSAAAAAAASGVGQHVFGADNAAHSISVEERRRHDRGQPVGGDKSLASPKSPLHSSKRPVQESRGRGRSEDRRDRTTSLHAAEIHAMPGSTAFIRGGAVKRSKSDAQDFITTTATTSTTNTTEPLGVSKPKLSHRLVRRSKSFQKLFNASKLAGRAREYSFQ